jgi:hypothetical protein
MNVILGLFDSHQCWQLSLADKDKDPRPHIKPYGLTASRGERTNYYSTHFTPFLLAWLSAIISIRIIPSRDATLTLHASLHHDGVLVYPPFVVLSS